MFANSDEKREREREREQLVLTKELSINKKFFFSKNHPSCRGFDLSPKSENTYLNFIRYKKLYLKILIHFLNKCILIQMLEICERKT